MQVYQHWQRETMHEKTINCIIKKLFINWKVPRNAIRAPAGHIPRLVFGCLGELGVRLVYTSQSTQQLCVNMYQSLAIRTAFTTLSALYSHSNRHTNRHSPSPQQSCYFIRAAVHDKQNLQNTKHHLKWIRHHQTTHANMAIPRMSGWGQDTVAAQDMNMQDWFDYKTQNCKLVLGVQKLERNNIRHVV